MKEMIRSNLTLLLYGKVNYCQDFPITLHKYTHMR